MQADYLLVRQYRPTKEAAMRPGTYRDKDDNLVTVRTTPTGYTITHADGTVTTIGGR